MAKVDDETLFRLSETLQMMQSTLECAICLDLLRDAVTTRCGHPFCRKCLTDMVAQSKRDKAPCPLCNAPVNRRGIIGNEKLRRLVQGVSVLISAVREDTGIDIMIQSRGPRLSSKEAFSPSRDPVKRGVVYQTAVASSSKVKDGRRSDKVESWLMKMPPPNSPTEPESQLPGDAPRDDDSDSEEMVSVSQAIPEQNSKSPLSTADQFDQLMLEYQQNEEKKCKTSKTQASNTIEDDGDTGECSESEDECAQQKKRTSCKLNKEKSAARKKATPVKKRRLRPIKGAVRKVYGPKITGKSNTVGKEDDPVKVANPVENLMDCGNEKENVAARSPGWSRVKKLKKEFHDPGKSVLKFQNTGNPENKEDSSSIPYIEDECSSASDDAPCLNLSIKSQDIRRKEKVNEIVASLENELEIYERSWPSNRDSQECPNVCDATAPKKTIVAEKSTMLQLNRNSSATHSRKEDKQNNEPKIIPLNLNSFEREQRTPQKVSREHTMKRVNRVCFLKLGKMARRKILVPFFWLGQLSSHYRGTTLVRRVAVPRSPQRHSDVQVQTSPRLSESQQNTCYSQFSAPFAVPLPGIEPKKRSSRGEKKSSEGDTDMIMDAETIILSPPIPKTGSPGVLITNSSNKQSVSGKCETNLNDTQGIPKENSQKEDKVHKVMSVGKVSHVADAFSSNHLQDGTSEKPFDIISQETIVRETSKDSINHNRSFKRTRASSNSGESTDSDPVFFRKSHSKKKRKNRVLSDNESNSPVGYEDMSFLESSDVIVNRINAKIEAELKDAEHIKESVSTSDESRRGFSPNWYDPVIQEDEDVVPASLTPERPIPPNDQLIEGRNSVRPPTRSQTPKTQADIFDDQSDAVSETAKAQVDTDSDSEMVQPTQHSSAVKKPVNQSEDIVPNSQPGEKPPQKQAVTDVSNPITSHQGISVHTPQNSTVSALSASPRKDTKPLGPSEVLQEQKKLNIQPLPSCNKVQQISLRKPSKLGFACSGLPTSCISQVVALAKLVKAEFSSKFDPKLVTHLVVRVNEDNTADKTLKYLNAVASGKWIVSMKWVLSCLKEKKLVPEDEYEVLDSGGEPGPRRSRIATEKLFLNFEFCCIGPFTDLTKEQLEDLLLQSGATIVSEPTKFSFNQGHYCITLVQYNEEKEQDYNKWLDQYCVPLVQHDWVLECIGKFAITSFWQLLVCDVSEEQLMSMGFPSHLIDSTDQESFATGL